MNDKVSINNLRRALVLYLVGFGLYLAVVSVWIGQGVSEFATPPSGTVSETPVLDVFIPVGGVVSVFVMVFSHIWYIGMKETWRRSEGYGQFLYRVRAKVGVLVLILFVFILLVYPDPFKRTFWISFIGAFVYFFIIVTWNAVSAFGEG